MGFLNQMFHGSQLPEFVLGVEDTFSLQNSADLVVVGKVKGTVHKGDAVYVMNFGDDDGSILLSSIQAIEIGVNRKANSATDCSAALAVANGAQAGIKCGTVLYSRQMKTADVHNAYVNALGAAFLKNQKFFLSPSAQAALSLTDAQELLGFDLQLLSKNSSPDQSDARRDQQAAAAFLRDILKQRLLAAKCIYCVYSLATGEPYLFSQTLQQENDYRCTPPAIMLLTKPYHEVLAARYPTEQFAVREIVNGTDGKGIADFLATAFYLNGACSAMINSNQVRLPAAELVPKPDFSQTPEISRPVMNPDLERWLLLMAQLGHPKTPDQETVYQIYVNLMQQALLKARLLIPMKHQGEIPPADENGRVVLSQGIQLSLATIDGKYGRPAVRMFTDWQRLKAGMGEGWEGMIQTVGDVIGQFDIAVNLTKDTVAGCYISKAMYDSIPRPSGSKA